MRLLIVALLFFIFVPVASAIGLQPYLGAELQDSEVDEGEVIHLVVLGALEKVNHELQPEQSELFQGIKTSETWYLPQARRTSDVADHYLPLIKTLGEVAFDCEGRSCGSSSFWANKVLNKAILYGPEQYQRYIAVRMPNDQGYLTIYIGQRATRKIYVQIEKVERLVVDLKGGASNMPLPDQGQSPAENQ